jgi:ABC-type uncharacterized transport system involved in gliding motility auxiliary subunit
MAQQKDNMGHSNRNGVLWAIAGASALGLLFARAVYPEYIWATIITAVLLIAALSVLMVENKKALLSRSAAYGANSAITVVLVIAIVGVINFLSSRYPYKIDTTKNKTHTLSDQTVKLVKGLKQPIKVTLFAKFNQKEAIRPLLENYKALNPKFEIEYVDPDREPTRAKESGIKKFNTVDLQIGKRESKVEDPTEEKLTNAIIKLLKDKTSTLCAVTGHGEKSFASTEADGYAMIKKSLLDQAYDEKDINIAQVGKIPDTCDAVAVIGASKSFFEPETKALREYLANGGRLIAALDLNVKGGESSPELLTILGEWGLKALPALVVDPIARAFNMDASVAIVATYSKISPITQDFQANTLFPISRPIDAVTPAIAGLTPIWIAQSTPNSWAVMDLASLKGAIQFNEGKDKKGPLNVAMSVEGKQKDSKAPRNTRIVVFGSSSFANNQFSRMGGNLDLFMNSVAWTLEDESMISIRTKDDGPGRVEMSNKEGTVIGLLTVFVIPFLIASGGIVIWILRKRL